MLSPIRVGIVGTGFGARVHLPAFQALPGARVVALADSGSGRAAQLAPPGVAGTDWRSLVSSPDIDAVVVALPPSAHLSVVEAAMAAGKHVLCEKPFGLNADQAAAMTAAAAQARRIGAVGFQFRYEPHLVGLRAALSCGQIGRLQRLELKWLHGARADTAFPWSWQNDDAAGGGIINALASHVVDLIAWLANSPVEAVESARTAILVSERPDREGVKRAVTAEDWVQASLRLVTGAAAVLELSNCIPGGQGMEILITGENGRLRCGQPAPFRARDAFLELQAPDGTALPLPIVPPPGNAGMDSRFTAVRALGEEFLKEVAGHASPVPDFRAGMAMRKVLDNIQHEANRLRGQK